MLQTAPGVTGVSLRQILPRTQFFGGEDIRVTSCCGDSRRCRPGDLFVALVGSQVDGHEFARQAVQRGARGVLAERPLAAGVPTCVVPDTREAYGQLCQCLAGKPHQQMQVFGVTGSHGKTITSMLIASVMEADQRSVGVTGSLGCSDSRETAPACTTTPSPPELASWLARMVANGCRSSVVEVSSRALAQRRIAGLEFDAAVLTNVRREHLDLHGSLWNYRRAKARLFEHLKPDGFAVMNVDDPASQHLLPKIDKPVITIGMRNPAELTASVMERHRSEQTFLLAAGHETVPVRTRMIGEHHVYNCLSAAAVGLVLGIDLTTVVRGLEAVPYVPGRLERIECGQPFSVFVDRGRSPDGLAVALKTLRRVTCGRVICVFGAEGHVETDKRPLMGRVAERAANVVVLTSDNPGHEQPLEIIHDILDGYERPSRAHVIPDRRKAIVWALEQARSGDSVLIAGKGDDDFQLVGDQRFAFDDRNIARRWLYQAGAQMAG